MKRTVCILISLLLTAGIISGFTACSGKIEKKEESSFTSEDTASVTDAATADIISSETGAETVTE